MSSRCVEKIIESIEEPEGRGAKVRRSIGVENSETRNFDPFLLLDEFMIQAPAGFPPHGHRGFETVTYMLKGKMKHSDFANHEGIIEPGDLEWMSAGRGIMHSEMPADNEFTYGLQLWINLAKEHKMMEPEYQELKKKDVPIVSNKGVTVKIIAGESMNTKSVVYTRTPTLYLDFKLEPNSSFTQPIPSDWNSFIYILEGKRLFGSREKEIEGNPHHTLILSKGDSITFSNQTNELLHFVLIAGKPLNEPIARGGPFVMNTEDEVKQAWDDYKNHKNGFEKGANWNPNK